MGIGLTILFLVATSFLFPTSGSAAGDEQYIPQNYERRSINNGGFALNVLTSIFAVLTV
jgi:hypothetical protein